MSAVTVEVGARVHVGFCNLSLARERLYGGIGIGLERPSLRLTARQADSLEVEHERAAAYAARALELLELDGVSITVERDLPEHVGLGSGTRLALAVLEAVGRAHGLEPDVREHAPALGRGGRSGVGVATYEAGGFVVDGGHPTAAFTTSTPRSGSWSVPPVVVRRTLPPEWRVVLVVPDGPRGRSGGTEDADIRTVVDRASPDIAERIATVVVDRLLPAATEGDLESFGAAVTAIGRRNGAWYADLQGGLYRPPVGVIVGALEGTPGLAGIGQSSWGPAVYGLTDEAHADGVAARARDALTTHGYEGTVTVTEPADGGRTVST